MGKFNFKDEQDFEKVRTDAEAPYAAIEEIRRSYFGEKITFNIAANRNMIKLKNAARGGVL